VYSVNFAPDGQTILTAGGDLATRVWDLHGTPVSSRPDPDFPVIASFDPTGTHVLTAEARQRATIWNRATGKSEVVLIGHNGQLSDAKWGGGGGLVVTSSTDGSARVWDATTGDTLMIIKHPAAVYVTAVSPDGRRVVLGGADGRAAIHELPVFRGQAADLAEVQRCRVPFEVQADRLVPRTTACTDNTRR
jgi:WD40 repeat protein